VEKKTQFNFWYFVIATIAVLYMAEAWQQYREVEPIPYSEFQSLLKAGKVREIAILDNYIQGTLVSPGPDGRDKFITTRVDPELAGDLAQYNVKFTGVVQSTWLRDILGWVIPALVFVGIWL
jgi:cell division protease FtsH